MPIVKMSDAARQVRRMTAASDLRFAKMSPPKRNPARASSPPLPDGHIYAPKPPAFVGMAPPRPLEDLVLAARSMQAPPPATAVEAPPPAIDEAPIARPRVQPLLGE
jgi:hypothetical protein